MKPQPPALPITPEAAAADGPLAAALNTLLEAVEEVLSGWHYPEGAMVEPEALVDPRDLLALEDAYDAFLDTLLPPGETADE